VNSLDYYPIRVFISVLYVFLTGFTSLEGLRIPAGDYRSTSVLTGSLAAAQVADN